MKKIVLILIVGLFMFSCKSVKNGDITGVIINSNNLSVDDLTNAFPNLTSITLKNCKMDNFDIGKLNVYIKEVIISDGCYGELFSSTDNHMIRKLEINESNIKSISSVFLEKLPDLEEIATFNTCLESIEFPKKSAITKVDIFNAQVSDFSSLSNLANLRSLSISQLEFDDRFDVTSISELSKIENLWLSSNFTISSEHTYQNIKNLGISSIPNYSLKSNVVKFKSLESLSINSYYDSSFPLYLSELPHLEKLGLYNTDISSFPNKLTDFTSLKSLDFVYSKVESFPEDILFPKSFKELNIDNSTFNFDAYKNKHPNISFNILEI
jgi:hypothetical protein